VHTPEVALPADANLEAISERIVRLDLGSELEPTLFHLEGLSLRPVVKKKYGEDRVEPRRLRPGARPPAGTLRRGRA
jgi:hypothetical protein